MKGADGLSDDGEIGIEVVQIVQPWLGRLRESVALLVRYVDVLAESDTMRPYRHVPLARRRAELTLFYLWWIDKFISRRVPSGEVEEACSMIFQALLVEEVPEIDIYGEERFEMFGYLETREAAINVYAVAPLKAMDDTIDDTERFNALVVLLAKMTEELDDLWGDS